TGPSRSTAETSTPSPTSASARSRPSSPNASTHKGGATFESPRSCLRVNPRPMLSSRPIVLLLSALAPLLLAGGALAADLATLVGNLTLGGFSEREAAITALAGSGEPRAAPVLEALAAGQLYVRTSDK